jgi:hypothetical protein
VVGTLVACAKEVLSVIPLADIVKARPLDKTVGRDNRSRLRHSYKDIYIGEGAKAHLRDIYYFSAYTLDAFFKPSPN